LHCDIGACLRIIANRRPEVPRLEWIQNVRARTLIIARAEDGARKHAAWKRKTGCASRRPGSVRGAGPGAAQGL